MGSENKMRIIGGQHRGRKIKQPGAKTARPTKDRIREAVFNIIAKETAGSDVLDMFACSGSYGLEALSRGAKSAVFIEKDPYCSRIIKENIQLLGLEKRTRVITNDAEKAIQLLSEEEGTFDLIFSDPPYNTDMGKKTLIMINHYDILKPTGLLIIEHHKDEGIPKVEGNISICKQKTYGDISISVFLRK